MNKTQWMTCALLATALQWTSCTSIDEGLQGPQSQGTLSLSLSSSVAFQETTRALNEASYANVNNYTVQVFDNTGAEKLSCKGSEIAANVPITLPIGSCVVKATYGKETPASRSDFMVLGEWAGIIKADQQEPVEVICTPTCGRITVAFGSEMNTYFTDYRVDFTGTTALGESSISWLKADTEPWYVLLNPTGETIRFTLTATTKEEYVTNADQATTSTLTGEFSLQRNKAYRMSVNPSYTPTTMGQISFEITIDESVNTHEEDIEVPITWI